MTASPPYGVVRRNGSGPKKWAVNRRSFVQGYTLARHIYAELGLKRVAILGVNDRYGRFGVGKFKDASQPPRPSTCKRTEVHAGRYRLPPSASGDPRLA